MGSFKLAKMTLSSLFSKPSTVQYPKEKPHYPEGLKGHISLNAQECILCGICMKNCTTNCISVERKEEKWSIDPFQCVQCGYCITVCPKKCLSMEPHSTDVSAKKSSISVHVDLPVKKKQPKKSVKPAIEQKTKEPSASKDASHHKSPASESKKEDSFDRALNELIDLMEPQRAQFVRKTFEK